MKLESWKPKSLEFKTAVEAAKYICRYSKITANFDCDKTWPCLQCHGKGYISEYTGVGNDYFDKDCHYCLLTGMISKKQFMEWYREQKEVHSRRIKQYRIDLAIQRSIRKKLTKEEVEFLNRFSL